MHIFTARIFDVSNTSHNRNVSINEIVFVSPPRYYMKWFEKYYLNVPLNWYGSPFSLQYMNGIRGKNPAGRQWNRLLDSVVAVLKRSCNISRYFMWNCLLSCSIYILIMF